MLNLIPRLTLASTLAASLALPGTALAASDDTVVAKVNGSAITEAMITRYAEQRSTLRAGDAPREQLINEVIGKELVYQDALKSGIDKDAELLERVERLRQELVVATALDVWADANPVSDEEVQVVYDEAVKQSAGSEYHARHILLENQADAEAVIVELDGGADFAELAKTKSTGPSAPTGGDLGWFRPQGMVPPFSEAVQKMEVGKWSSAPVKTDFGWHVILLEGKRPTAPPPLEQVRDQIVSQLEQFKLQSHVEDLRAAADITISEP